MNLPEREVRRIIVHCSYTPVSMDIGVGDIRSWHVEDNGWRDVGYHWVIRRDGGVEAGRPEGQAGAHAAGHNSDSVGVCLVGGMRRDRKGAEFNYTAAQMVALVELVAEVEGRYGPLEVIGHRDVNAAKECPCFDVRSLLVER